MAQSGLHGKETLVPNRKRNPSGWYHFADNCQHGTRWIGGSYQPPCPSQTKPKKDSVKSIFTSISECVNNHKAVSQKELIRMITPKIRGWANFFRHSAAKQTFSRLDNKVFKLLWKWAKRRHPNKGNHWIKAKYFKNKGNRCWVFSTTDKIRTCELPLFDATKIIRHTKIKSLSNPYDKVWEGYFKERAKGRLAKQGNISKLATAI